MGGSVVDISAVLNATEAASTYSKNDSSHNDTVSSRVLPHSS